MRVFIIFATTEGHTRKLARFAATRLAQAGHAVRACDAAEPDPPDLAGFDAALVMASVHIGHYQPAFVSFARAHHGALNAMPTAFVSVSLSAAGNNPSDRAGLCACVDRLERDTLWHPGAVHHAAGAMPFSAYGLVKKLAIKWIARRRGRIVNTSEDYDLTDYGAFARFVDRFVNDARFSTQTHMPAHA